MEWRDFIQLVVGLGLLGYGIGWFIKKMGEF